MANTPDDTAAREHSLHLLNYVREYAEKNNIPVAFAVLDASHTKDKDAHISQGLGGLCCMGGERDFVHLASAFLSNNMMRVAFARAAQGLQDGQIKIGEGEKLGPQIALAVHNKTTAH